jgi:hypothetical protein
MVNAAMSERRKRKLQRKKKQSGKSPRRLENAGTQNASGNEIANLI